MTVSKMLECTENRDRVGKVVIETIKVKRKNTRGASLLYEVNFYRTTRSLVINSPQIDKCKPEIMPVIQS